MESTKEQGIKTRKKIEKSVIQYIQEHGYPPTIREIGEAVGIKSPNTIHAHLAALIDEGELETDAGFGSPRAIRVPGYEFVKLEEIKRCSKPLPTKDGYVQMVYRD